MPTACCGRARLGVILATVPALTATGRGHSHDGEEPMSKSLDSKKSEKKKPAKTMKEKKAAKQEKKKNAK
jgi:hypothetical protein